VLHARVRVVLQVAAVLYHCASTISTHVVLCSATVCRFILLLKCLLFNGLLATFGKKLYCSPYYSCCFHHHHRHHHHHHHLDSTGQTSSRESR
jgi:hypothetical protein